MGKDNFRRKEKVKPRMAKVFLDSRKDNKRAISDKHVAELADAMLKGRWLYNGESLKFDEDGHLIDGQHRCAACIRAGRYFETDIVFGLRPDAYYTIDQKLKKRTAGDVLKIEGEINYNTVAAALMWHIAYKNNYICSNGKSWKFTPDSQQICSELRHHPEIRESVKKAIKCRHLMGPGPLGFLHYIFQEKDKEIADDFFEKLASGENLSNSHPVLFIRQMLYEDKIKNKAKLPLGEKMACIIKGWNLLRNGKRASSRVSIKWTSAGRSPESFPKAI